MNTLDKVLMALAPGWALSRVRARAAATVLARHYDAASSGYRTDNWPKRHTDANAANGPALATLRAHGRDLHRNNAWAQNGLRAISRNTVGWGLMPKAATQNADLALASAEIWKTWAESTECDADGRSTFYGLQRQIVESVARDGEVLVRKRVRRLADGLPLPLQLQVLEADFLDTTKDGIVGEAGGPIIQGVEFDKLGRRAAYWIYEQHPGANARALGLRKLESHRVPASAIAHVFRNDRPGQVRGASWLSSAIVSLKDFDEFEDATIVRQKIAACFAVFVTDPEPNGTPLGVLDTAATTTAPAIEVLQPGMIQPLPPGKSVSFASPPENVDGEFTKRTLRKIAAALGVTYEDLTGDYSQVNFSSARMARLAHWSNVHDWRWNMLVPQFCDVAWMWAQELALVAGKLRETTRATWTPPPMPMIEPDKEGLALQRLVRAGAMTPDEMVREQGYDPDTHWREYAESFGRLDQLGIVIDGDARKVTQSGMSQSINASKSSAPTTE